MSVGTSQVYVNLGRDHRHVAQALLDGKRVPPRFRQPHAARMPEHVRVKAFDPGDLPVLDHGVVDVGR